MISKNDNNKKQKSKNNPSTSLSLESTTPVPIELPEINAGKDKLSTAILPSTSTEPPLTFWNIARAGKLGFFLLPLIMGTAGFATNTIFRFLNYFIPNFSWLGFIENIISAVLTSVGFIGTASYSYTKNLGVYNGDGKSEGNIQILEEIRRYKKEPMQIKQEAGEKYIKINKLLPLLTLGLSILYSIIYIFSQLGQQFDDKKQPWLTALILIAYPVATLIGLVEIVLIAGIHEIVASNLRNIQLKAVKELEQLQQLAVEQEKIELKEEYEKLIESFAGTLNLTSNENNELRSKIEQIKNLILVKEKNQPIQIKFHYTPFRIDIDESINENE